MTENEAIKIATYCLGVQAEQEVCEECPVYRESGIVCKEIARTAISALKEIQQYRKIGTVEECREAVEKQKGMQVSGMRDDLISRKAFMEYLGLGDTEKNREENVGEIVTLEDFDRQPTAFDKERVLSELGELTGEECTLHECGIRSEKCKVCIAKKAIEIVEKGGIG